MVPCYVVLCDKNLSLVSNSLLMRNLLWICEINNQVL